MSSPQRECTCRRCGKQYTAPVESRHRLLCGDSIRLDAIEKVLGGGLADMVFTDPPYNVNYGATMKDKLRGKTHRKIANDNLGAAFGPFLYDACVNMLTVTKGALYICMFTQAS